MTSPTYEDVQAHAVEEVLRGPYETCKACDGAGLFVGKNRRMCATCNGGGSILRDAYRAACTFLKLEDKYLEAYMELRKRQQKTMDSEKKHRDMVKLFEANERAEKVNKGNISHATQRAIQAMRDRPLKKY